MADRPNILWVSFEDTSPRFGCYGDPVAKKHNLTPRLDALAAEGVIYPKAFSVAGVCAPSRHAIITGHYPTATGAHQMRTGHGAREDGREVPYPYECVPPAWVKLLPERLRAEGYYCTNNVKTDYQFKPPVSAFDDNSTAGHWRNRHEPGQPFFAIFNNAGNGPSTHESGMWADVFEGQQGRRDPEVPLGDIEVPPYLPDTPAVRTAIARQYENIAISDAWLGEKLDQLEADGLADNTIVVIWSDHGEGLPRKKRWPYDTGTHIPLIVRYPRKLRERWGDEAAGGLPEAGTIDDRLVSLIDLPPTMLSLCGFDVPAHLHGVPFAGPGAVQRGYAFATRDRHDATYDMMRAVRDRRYRYVRHYQPELPRALWMPYRDRHPAMRELWRMHAAGELTGDANLLFEPRPGHGEELFDTEADPHEMHNLAEDPLHAETLARMRAAVDDWRATHDVFGDVDEADMLRRWWPGGEQPTTAVPWLCVHDPVRNAPECPQPTTYPGRDAEAATAEAEPPALVQMCCATQGASIVWTDEAGDDPRWRLYTTPVRLPDSGTVTIRARAHRIGYLPSDEAVCAVTVSAGGAT